MRAQGKINITTTMASFAFLVLTTRLLDTQPLDRLCTRSEIGDNLPNPPYRESRRHRIHQLWGSRSLHAEYARSWCQRR